MSKAPEGRAQGGRTPGWERGLNPDPVLWRLHHPYLREYRSFCDHPQPIPPPWPGSVRVRSTHRGSLVSWLLVWPGHRGGAAGGAVERDSEASLLTLPAPPPPGIPGAAGGWWKSVTRGPASCRRLTSSRWRPLPVLAPPSETGRSS